MDFKRKFKLTTGELLSLSMVAVAVGAITVATTVKSCSQPSDRLNDRNNLICDSITSLIEKSSNAADSAKTIEKKQRKKKGQTKKHHNSQRVPTQRNYLDEPANE